jgi:hypothetical protein
MRWLLYIVSEGGSHLLGMHIEGVCHLHESDRRMRKFLTETEHKVKTTRIRLDSWAEDILGDIAYLWIKSFWHRYYNAATHSTSL